MKRIPAALLLLLMGPTAALAQGTEGLFINFGGTHIVADGSETGGAWTGTPSTNFQKTDFVSISIIPYGCGSGPGSRHSTALEPGSAGGWTGEITPLRVEGDAVSFRLKWTRFEGAGAAGRPGGDLEVTLHPGQSMPVDILPTPRNPATCPPGAGGSRAIMLSVSLARRPDDDEEHRLMATELWLIEKLPDGSERLQALTVRGLPFRPTSFFFDSVTDGGAILDFYGEFVTAPGTDGADIKLTTRSRLIQSGQVSTSLRLRDNLYGGREVRTNLKLGNNVVGAVELPKLSDNDGSAFAGHTFSLRLRTRQIR